MAGVSSIAVVVVLALGVPAVALFVLYRAANRDRGLSTRTARGTVADETTAGSDRPAVAVTPAGRG